MMRSMTSAALAPLLLTLAACSSTPDTGGEPAASQFLIVGADLSGYAQNAFISVGGVPATGLTVTINGTALADAGGGLYSGHLAAAIPTGGAIQVQVTNGTLTATGNTTIPDAPAITAAGAVNHGDPLAVTWTSATSPDSFLVTLNYTLPDQSSAGTSVWVGGALRQASVPTTAVPVGATNFYVGLEALRMGTFSGAAAAHSSMHVRAESPDFPVTLP